MTYRGLWLGLPVVLLVSIACDDTLTHPVGSPTHPVGSPAEVQLQIGEAATIASGKVVVRFASVEQDSRCPTGVNCFWQGEAVVLLELEEEGQDPGSSSLSTLVDRGKSPNTIRVGDVSLRLVELHPYPAAGDPIEPSDYVLTLRVE